MTPYYQDDWLTVYQGDCREVLTSMEPESVHCVVTSPPYWGLRDYGTATWVGGDDACGHPTPPRQPRNARPLGAFHGGSDEGNSSREPDTRRVCHVCGATRVDSQLGLEPTPELYVENMVAVFREVRRVLRSDGTLWLNLGDSYASHDPGGYRQGEFLNPGGREPVKGQARNRAGNYRPGGLKPKDLVGIPWRVAFALQADGWYLRSDIIWSKPNPMPESVTDRPTKSHEYLFLLTKSARYWYDADAVREPALWPDGPNAPDAIKSPYGQGFTRSALTGGAYSPPGQSPHANARPTWAARKAAGAHAGGHGTGLLEGSGTQRNVHGDGLSHDLGSQPGRNLRSVWSIATQPYPEAHFATFPPKLVEPCIKAGCPTLGTVLDPFAGSGTTGLVAQSLSRRAVLIDLNADYLRQAMRRNAQSPLGLETA